MTTTEQAIDALRALAAEVYAIEGDHTLAVHLEGRRAPRVSIDVDDLSRILEAGEQGLEAERWRESFESSDTENMRLLTELTEERTLRMAYRDELDTLRPIAKALAGVKEGDDDAR